jgi:hypothetical protein
MAPGCFTMEQQQQQQYDSNNCDMLIINESSYDLENVIPNNTANNNNNNVNNNKDHTSHSELLKPITLNSNYPHIFTSYHHEINLDSIPLPSEPYPAKTNDAADDDNAKIDTIDSFEILEQTIMKQKRLGRSKNVDLRKKILLKRTFDLVCEIMDHENGFEEEEKQQQPQEQEVAVLPPDLENLEEIDNKSTTYASLQTTPITSDTTNDDLIKTILNEENLFNNYNNSSILSFNSYSNFTSSPSLKRKIASNCSTKFNKKFKCQRRPSNSDEDEDDEYDDDEQEDEEDFQNNYISLFDDDNDPFGIADVVNFTSFKQ